MSVRRFGAVWLVLVSVMVAGCSSAAGGASAKGNPNAQPATVVTVAKATTGPISQGVSYTGTVQGAESVNVAPTISGRITKLNVDVGSVVRAGDLIAELDKSILSAQVEQAQGGLSAANAKLAQVKAGARPETVAAAKANVAAAQAKLDAVKAGSRTEIVAQAKANLDGAKAKLAQLKAGPTSEQVEAAQLAVEQAKDALWTQQTSRDGVCGNAHNPTYMCNQADAQVGVAETALKQAQQQLKILTSPPTKEAIDQAQAAVDAAQQAYLLAQQPYTAQDLAQAQAAVDAATEQAKLAAQPYTDADLKSAQAAVEQAQAALDAAQAQLRQAEITAPFDGVITAKLLSVGALASPSTPIVTMMSPDLQVQFAIDESRIANVKAGQAVSLTSSAFPGKQFSATITSVYPSADPKTHTFTVVAKPDDGGGELRAGMFLTLNVTVASSPNAVLVPSAAIIQQGSQSVVFTVAGNQAHLVPITAGIADNSNTQILSGLKAGDQVVTTNQARLTDGAPVRVQGQTTSESGAQAPGGDAGQAPGGTASPPRRGPSTSASGGPRQSPAASPTP